MANNQDSSFFPRLDLQLNSNSIDELLKVLQVVRPSWFSLNVKFEVSQLTKLSLSCVRLNQVFRFLVMG